MRPQLNHIGSLSKRTEVFLYFYQLKKQPQLLKEETTIESTVTFMARKDTRSPSPQHECHLKFNYKFNSRKTKIK